MNSDAKIQISIYACKELHTNNIVSNDVEILKTVPATTAAIKAAIPNPDQTVEVKQENENISKIINEVASNSKFVPPLPPSLASADSNSQQNQSALGANSFKNIQEKARNQNTSKSLKKPKSFAKKDWEKLNDEQKREITNKIAQDDFDASNQAARTALATSLQVKRQGSMAEIDKELSKKPANNDDCQSQASSLSFYSDNENDKV
jgi:hypothetical protein